MAMRRQWRICAESPSDVHYHMESPDRWYVRVPHNSCEYFYSITIPVDFPLSAATVTPLSYQVDPTAEPICADGASSISAVIAVIMEFNAAATLPPPDAAATVNIAAKIAASFAEYSTKW